MAQLITIFCEGPHDVNFIYRMLKALGYLSYDKCKIKDLPPPFNNFIQSEIEKTEVQGLNLIEIRRTFLPAKVLLKDNKYLFLYTLGGDTKVVKRQEMLNDIFSFVPEPDQIGVAPDNTQFSAIYLFDADDKGVKSRLEAISKEVNALELNTEQLELSSNGTFQRIGEINFGTYIFTGTDNQTGTLEDILLPLMKDENEDIFSDAEKFISDHFSDNRLFPLKIKIEALTGKVSEVRSTRRGHKYKFYEKKSIIGVVGQLQCSGKSNVVCISDSDFITVEKIGAHSKCIEILNFLNKI